MTTHVGDSYTDLRAALLVRAGITGPDRSRALATLTDGWLTELATNAGVTVGGVALVAVGGYGRGELSPFSDVDLVLLHSSETPAGYAEMIAQRLWYPIWDSKVRLDHAVRSVGGARQVARSDLPDLLGVLDIRHIAGDPELGVGLRRRVLADWRADAPNRLPELLEMCRARWERCGDLAFATAGDLKSSRGGLRDLVVMRAVAASWVADCPHQGLEEARGELLTIREALQLVTGRSTDRLQAQDQDGVAAYLGLPDSDELLRSVAAIGRTVGHAIDLTWHRVHRALQQPTAGGRPERRPLADGVVKQDGEAVLARAADPAHDPVLPLRAAAAAAQAGIPIAPATLARLAKTCPPLPQPWPAAALDELLRLLGSGHQLISVWESLDQVGVISSLIPGWERLRSLPQRDPVHQFTVDRHLVQTAVEASKLLRRVARPDLLLIAALLHDIGKGTGRDHSVAGAALAADLCTVLGLGTADTAVVSTLVRHHLLLAETAPRRDPDDPATVSLVTDAVGDVGVLDLLQALTEADALAAGPAAWSSWKASQLATLAAKARAALDGWPAVGPEPLGLIESELLTAAEPDVRIERAAGALTVLVAARDRTGLLADVAGALTAQRLTIRSATTRTEDGIALQTWLVAPEFGEPPEAASLRSFVRGALIDPTAARAAAAKRLTAARRGNFPAPTVTVADGASAASTVLEIRAHDLPGMLLLAAAEIAAAGVTVVRALVHTWGAEAVDVLYLQGADGTPLPAADARRL
ncbi:MAG: [protein-PII] uridylyltransferase, partial [Actinomycetota bacterium]|nr:[protein-PII] uridylyltransferase [Actinomycetota bacterium]